MFPFRRCPIGNFEVNIILFAYSFSRIPSFLSFFLSVSKLSKIAIWSLYIYICCILSIWLWFVMIIRFGFSFFVSIKIFTTAAQPLAPSKFHFYGCLWPFFHSVWTNLKLHILENIMERDVPRAGAIVCVTGMSVLI